MMRTNLFRPWDRFFASDPPPPETLHTWTSDGLRLAIHRVPPPGGRGPAVILCHGLSTNHEGFHFAERSLAGWLAARGWDCYLPDLRGAGASESPGLCWDLDDHVYRDVPAILAEVLRSSGQERVHWIGHSMGGIILLCHGIAHPDAPIASGVAIASALDYRLGNSGYRNLLAIKPLLEKLPGIPYGAFVHLLAPLLGRFPTPLDAFQVCYSNIEPELIRRLHARCFHSIPISLLRSLATTFEERGLCNRDRSLHYLEEAGSFSIPVRLLAGSADRQVSVDAVRHTAGLLGGTSDFRVFGTAFGHGDEYGHWDLLLGRRAETEVWPWLFDWLQDHSAQGKLV